MPDDVDKGRKQQRGRPGWGPCPTSPGGPRVGDLADRRASEERVGPRRGTRTAGLREASGQETDSEARREAERKQTILVHS